MAFAEDYLLARIRQKLQEDGVKLWLAPYFDTSSTAAVDDKLQELAFNYSDILAIPSDTALTSLKTLQAHALEKLASRTQFQQTGLATLRVKVIGAQFPQTNILIALHEFGDSLRHRIFTELKIQPNSRIKMISGGVVLEDNKRLQDQRVTNNSQILALMLSADLDSQRMEEKIVQEVELVKADANLLASQDDENYLRIADQSGKVMELPFEEKKALAIAMTLHEKGRSALKRNKVSLALTLFHEAEASFNSCRSELLNAVDNAALLNLDIAWCYLLLGSAAEIPDAAVRLDKCEQSLYKSYGPQMERLLTLKGTTGNEAVLFLRLHLLQGVVAFHQGKALDANRILHKANEELTKLSINDDDLSQLINLGYSLSDARLGLRACRGDLNSACVYLQRRTEEREKRDREEEEEDVRDRKRKKLGRTANGQWVNLGYLKTITDMGFEESRAADALRQTNNNMSGAIEYLQSEASTSATFYNEESLMQVVSMGFSIEDAKEALEKCSANVELAIEHLTSKLGQTEEEDVASTLAKQVAREMVKKEREAYKRLAKDIPKSEEDHLDTNLELEKEFLQKYLSFLDS